MSTIKVGIIGAGAISRDHGNSVNAYAGAEVVAIADPHRQRAKTLAKELGVKRVYLSAEALIGDPDIDAVTIAVPNTFHAPYSIAALNAGKHVSLDKPFTLNAAEAKQVIAAAKRNKKVFMLGMNWRFRPESQTVREVIKRGDIGDIYHAKATILRRTGCPKFGTWFGRKDLAGGGALLDIGVHFLDLCLFVIDNFEPVAVSGAVYTKFGHRGIGEGGWGHSTPGKHVFDVDDFGTALIKMKNGATVTLNAAWVLHMETPGRMAVEAFGTEGGASVSPPKIFRFAKQKGEYEVVEPQGIKIPLAHCNRFHNWLDAVNGTDKPLVTLDQALAVQKILDAIYKSSETGREVRIR